MTDDRPYLWLVDSDRKPLAECIAAFDGWADLLYIGPENEAPAWEEPPDAVFFSAEIRGGAAGRRFADLHGNAGHIPLLAVAKLRSLAQALSYFRAGAADYLPLPVNEDEIRERLVAALERAEQLSMPTVMVELESLDGDPGEVSLSLRPPDDRDTDADVDILAAIPGGDDAPAEQDEPDAAAEAEEPEAVDGLPIPTLWEELPCGLLVFDSRDNLVFSNSLGMELFGHASLAELQEALEERRGDFAAYGANHKPLPDNQWPHIVAKKTRTARSAVVSLEKADKRRSWIRIDCLPHLSEGKINRLSMTVVNLTGELPPLVLAPPVERQTKGKARNKRRKAHP